MRWGGWDAWPDTVRFWAWPWPGLQFLLLVAAMLAVRQDAPRPVPPAKTAASTAPAAAAAAPGKSTPLPASARPIDANSAARFLAQATFGPTLEEIERVRQIGYRAWLDDQFAQPTSSQLNFIKAAGSDTRREWRLDAWFVNAVGGQDPFDPALVHRDQLRQRVAFALSEIFVVSDATSDQLGNAPHGMTNYYDRLAYDAFGNFRTLLEDVTLHPVMGIYLSMLGNQKPDPANNIRPDENYAREVLQLFSIGLVMLNQDGTPKLDGAGKTIPTYNQDTVKGFAHVFTGWTFKGCAGTWDGFECYIWDSTDPSWISRMEAFPEYHASAQAKQLLVYPGVSLPNGVLAGGGTAASDLKAALDNIFRHPNVGPFVGRQLIQRLVTSNPSPGYVSRVAAKFNNNGQGVRGDMKAVIRAILFDPEARDPTWRPPHGGKVREPILRLTHLWRALNARSQSGHMDEFWTLSGNLGQAPMSASSVFNFFSPRYMPTGEPTALGLAAPELQLATDYMLPSTESYLGWKVYDVYIGNPDLGPDEIAIDLSRDTPLAANPSALVDRYNLLFMSGQMSVPMRHALLERLQGMPGSTEAQRRTRVQEALYLIINSPEYVVQK
ncbi:DUF1800 domain-containing protein [Luteimonas sp. SX5]|uniref:DUF1800 domain-containing protein n=1 Tax=Luteimonas galliterrae TaxID=2940486 RepID=A0ABT0MJW2_9GAMM|nr:DUF1800 domain-containing protein [Luteimonas galliterrae]MCL1635154.1 DUF1800 domain-containing protein [Luteimonas galliterrae]